MNGAAAVPTRLVESAPERHRPKECAHDMRVFATAAIETAFKRHPRRGLAVSFGLQAIESPCHDPSPNLTQQGAEITFKRHGRRRCWLGVDKPIKEPGAPGEQARKLHDERFKGRCQQSLGWRRMNHRRGSELVS